MPPTEDDAFYTELAQRVCEWYKRKHPEYPSWNESTQDERDKWVKGAKDFWQNYLGDKSVVLREMQRR